MKYIKNCMNNICPKCKKKLKKDIESGYYIERYGDAQYWIDCKCGFQWATINKRTIKRRIIQIKYNECIKKKYNLDKIEKKMKKKEEDFLKNMKYCIFLL